MFDDWRHKKKCVLKTLDDWNDWSAYSDLYFARKEGYYLGRGSLLNQFKRWFLKAYTNKEFGLSGGDYEGLADWLTENGYPTKVNDIKNAKRNDIKLLPAPPVDLQSVKALYKLLISKYPTLLKQLNSH